MLHKQCPRNLIGILWLAIDPTGPRVSIDHGSQTDGIYLGQLDSYDGICIGQNWSLLSLYITHWFHATLNRYLLIKKITKAFDIELGTTKIVHLMYDMGRSKMCPL